jgi:ArpU family phage transcriptional regulator
MQMSMGDDFLPELDRKRTQKAVQKELEKYRLYKYLEFDEREATITQSSAPRYHGPTNVTSDQTAQVAIHNVDARAARRAHVDRIERAVNRLPRMEKFLITERYLGADSEYITDQAVYNHRFNPPISEPTYTKIRWKAFYKLALFLDIAATKGSTEDDC